MKTISYNEFLTKKGYDQDQRNVLSKVRTYFEVYSTLEYYDYDTMLLVAKQYIEKSNVFVRWSDISTREIIIEPNLIAPPKKTRAMYEKFLNSISPPPESDEWIIGGVQRFYFSHTQQWGTAIRKYEPLRFEEGYSEYLRSEKQPPTNQNITP